MSQSADSIVDEIFARFAARGHLEYGENVTELQHALQAATFAERDGQPDAIVAACLLHDYGHLCHGLGEDIADHGIDANHEAIGARALAKWFPTEVVEPGRLHVEAKRYLCAVDPEYLAGLSSASLQSLSLQGGVMSEAEAHAFEGKPYFEEAVALRRYDDMGKIPEMKTPDLEHFRPVLLRVLQP